MKRRLLLFMVLCVAALACGKSQQTEKKPLTTAQRDSLIGESSLPGAGVVKKAIEQSDSAKARADRENEDYQ
jgi:hypothetical protein